ncbi:quinone oxidoreductase [bacterium SCGC AG-212-C10]|nr:quinone oxidoreductase [bacterium SCGC AG-212-C10]
MPVSYRAFVVNKVDGEFSSGVTTLEEADLPPGEVTVNVEWSSVNFKDGLASAANSAVIRKYPMVPGIDLAGTVIESTDTRYTAGQPVIVIGYETGVSHPGGFAQKARVPANWVSPTPAGLTTKEAMALGTAGFTAAMSVEAIQKHGITPASGPVLVTGATGGVGSTAIAMLSNLGYTIAASTGKEAEHEYLKSLGATEILTREEVSAESTRPMESERWAAVVDPVGGSTCAYALRTTKREGIVALSGNTGGFPVATTVLPFILRGITLAGIESVQYPIAERIRLWHRCATDLKPRGLLDSIAHETNLDGLSDALTQILGGQIRGRVLVNTQG